MIQNCKLVTDKKCMILEIIQLLKLKREPTSKTNRTLILHQIHNSKYVLLKKHDKNAK